MGRERGCTTANRTLQLLRAVINKMKSWDFYTGNNPAEGISKFKEVSRERFLETDEVPRFFEALAEEPPYIRDYILLCLLTGARKSRVAEMRWDQVNLERGTWRIPGELEKNGKEHVVPLVPKALEIVKRRQAETSSEWVFPSKSKTGHLVSPKNAWLRVKKRAGLDDLHLHDLRRTLGSWQRATGADLALIGRTLNHKDISTTLIYARLNIDPIRQSMEAATSALLNAAEPPPPDNVPPTEPEPLKLVTRHRRTVGA
jgi:integrase